MTDAPPSVEPPGDEAGWVLVIEHADGGDAAVQASLLSLSNGDIGVRGDLEDRDGVDHYVLVNGAYGTGSDGVVRPVPGPAVTVLGADGNGSVAMRSELDLRAGVVRRTPLDGGLRSRRFVSVARPGVVALEAEDGHADRAWPAPLARPAMMRGLAAEHRWSAGECGGRSWAETVSDRCRVVAVADQWCEASDDGRRVERIVALRVGGDRARADAEQLLDEARLLGFEGLLEEHRAAWADRWRGADIEIEGDPASQLAVRFALFHLLSCAPETGSAAVGARGLTGLAYAGHVFWDTDVYVLPALAATLPDAARAMLTYRAERLDVARANARDRGLPGARFPWESADSGRDVTPTATRDLEGRSVPIRTGEHAEHINADIAWAVCHLMSWTGDHDPLDGQGLELVRETARYWLARLRADTDGRNHLYGVIGPDEYHEVVDDNAYTNGMVRWHLRCAAALARQTGDVDEAAAMEAAAAALVDGFDPATGRHEQFAGFRDLEPVLIGDLVQPPVAADVLLGRERVRRSQILKQPDVLMLHHLLPDECPPGSLASDLDHYLPRTAHGSSLSPAICASLLARAGRPDDAMELFDIASRIDLDDLTDTTAGGLHLATMGGLWQAVVFGFAGIRPQADGLSIDPMLPRRWTRLSVRLQHRGQPIRVTITHDAIEVDADRSVRVVVRGRPMRAPLRLALARPQEGP